jgi:RecA/RadA recombinase
MSHIILSRLRSTPEAQAVYIDTLGTFNASLLRNLLPSYSTSETAILDRIHLMRTLDIVTLIEACENVKQSLADSLPIELLIIDTIANPISLIMSKGHVHGTFPPKN